MLKKVEISCKIQEKSYKVSATRKLIQFNSFEIDNNNKSRQIINNNKM
jgi:hypothetical protein